jgi:DNA repair exonuclease SbcCD ATPase subunit
MSLLNDLLELFTSEYAALENLVNALNFDSELPVNEIVEVYYQITSLSSLITVVKSQLDKNNDAVLRAETFISKKFNSAIHPKIMGHIETLISDITSNLQSANSEQKSNETIENEAKLYEKLREIMSTKEFVKQYDAGLSYD